MHLKLLANSDMKCAVIFTFLDVSAGVDILHLLLEERQTQAVFTVSGRDTTTSTTTKFSHISATRSLHPSSLSV